MVDRGSAGARRILLCPLMDLPLAVAQPYLLKAKAGRQVAEQLGTVQQALARVWWRCAGRYRCLACVHVVQKAQGGRDIHLALCESVAWFNDTGQPTTWTTCT